MIRMLCARLADEIVRWARSTLAREHGVNAAAIRDVDVVLRPSNGTLVLSGEIADETVTSVVTIDGMSLVEIVRRIGSGSR